MRIDDVLAKGEHTGRLSRDEIVSLAMDLDDRGLRTIVLQSGEDPFYTAELLAGIVLYIKAKTGMAVTL